MIKKSKKSFLIFMSMLLSIVVMQPTLLKVKAEDNVPTYLEYTKASDISFSYQWKNKTFLVERDGTKINTSEFGKYPNNLKFVVIENGKEKTVTTDAKFMPDDTDVIKVYNDELYFQVYDEPDYPNLTWLNVKKHIYKYNLNTLQLSFVEEVPDQPKNFMGPEYEYNDVRAIMDDNGKIIFAFDYNNKNTGTEYKVFVDGEKQTVASFDITGEIPEVQKEFYIANLTGDHKGNTFFTVQKNYTTVPVDAATQEELRQKINYEEDVMNKALADGTIKREEYLYMVDSKFNLVKINKGDSDDCAVEISDMFIDKQGNMWLSGSYENLKTHEFQSVVEKVIIDQDNNLKILEKRTVPEGVTDIRIQFDVNDNLWILNGGKVQKYENGAYVTKYKVYDSFHNDRMHLYDDNNLVVLGDAGYTIISQNVPESSVSNNNPYTVSIDSSGKIATLSYAADKLNKNGVNELNPNLDSNIQTVEARLDAPTVSGGTGSLSLNANNVKLELPFSTVDYDGCTQGSYVSVSETVTPGDSALSSIKSIERTYNFGLATYKADGTKLKDIHQFKNGKAELTVKLTADDIKNLDAAKLAAFYYNENTKKWENVGGNFDKNAMTFTFETNHFSKYTIAQIPDTLPQTGSVMDFDSLMMFAGILVLMGALAFIRKAKAE